MKSLSSSVNVRRLGQVGVDACLLALAYYLAYVLRFDEGIPPRYEHLLGDTIVLTVAMKLVIFAMFGLYSKLWRFVGHKVLGTTDELPRVLDGVKPDEVIIAIPSAPGILRQKVVTACRERAIPVRTLPTVFEMLSGGVNLMRQVREVRVEDVLGREPVRMEIDRVGAYLSGEVVLVTGAGGSIGAELCRQISRVGPKRLVLVDNAENSLF